jgi:hypothetical protein
MAYEGDIKYKEDCAICQDKHPCLNFHGGFGGPKSSRGKAWDRWHEYEDKNEKQYVVPKGYQLCTRCLGHVCMIARDEDDEEFGPMCPGCGTSQYWNNRCRHCEQWFDNENECKDHFIKVCRFRVCNYCGECFDTKDECESHMKVCD